MMRWIALVMLLAAGCAAHPAPTRVVIMPPTQIGKSVQGRPIELHRIGAGDRPVLVMAAIHGDEPTSSTVANGLLQYLREHPTTTPVAIILAANPDGYAVNTRTNAHQVDLNRNFPAANWSSRSSARSRKNFGGPSSASEPETAALMRTIESLHPRLIISIHSMQNPCNNYDGPAKEIADLMSKSNGYPVIPTIGYPTPGSLGSWAGIDRQIPMITLELPRRLDGARAWETNRAALLAAIAASR